MTENRLGLIKAFSDQPNKLLDKQRVTNKDTLMYPVFQNALRGLKNIMDNSEKWVNENSMPQDRGFYTYCNNILAFCGPRGQGKTSAMLSLSYALEHCNDSREGSYLQTVDADGKKHYRLNKEDPVWADTIDGSEFLVMPPIDPTVLDEKESVVGLVLAWLLAKINEAWKTQDEPADFIEQKQVEVLQHFQKCRDCLALHSGVKERDLSALIKSSNILDLKNHLYKIIECYFQLYGHKGKMHYLIIQLDDTDMDMVNAYDVLEDTRKFLSLPQTVVFMATYLRQLRTLVAKQYEKALSLSRIGKDAELELADCTQMAAKYLDKLIPSQQMVHINSFRYQRDLNGIVKIGDFIDDLSDVLSDQRAGAALSAADFDADLEEEFYALIRRKTGLIFLKHDTYVNNILPTTLRGLVHLYQLLDKMKTPQFPEESDYKKQMGKQDASYYRQYINALRVQQRNLILFEDYFRNDWCYINLKEKDQEILWTISQAHLAPKLRIIRNLLVKRWAWVDGWLENHSQDCGDNNSKKGNTKNNKSSAKKTDGKNAENMGASHEFYFVDLVQLLDDGEALAENMEDLMLVFAIRTHLSLVLNKLYLSDILNSLCKIEFSAKNSSEFEKGVYRWIEHPQLELFCGYLFSAVKYTSTAALQSQNKAILSSQTPAGYSKKERIEFLYALLFRADLYTHISNITLNKMSFGLQAAAFRVLGNHDVLRLWLSDNPGRFIKSWNFVGYTYNLEPNTPTPFILWDNEPGKQESINTILERIRVNKLKISKSKEAEKSSSPDKVRIEDEIIKVMEKEKQAAETN